jgi:hypothetical protein
MARPSTGLQKHDIEPKPKMVKATPPGIKLERAADTPPLALGDQVAQRRIGAPSFHFHRTSVRPRRATMSISPAGVRSRRAKTA